LTKNEAHDFTLSKLGACGCADEDALALIKHILGALEAGPGGGWQWPQTLTQLCGATEPVAYCLLFLLDQAKLIEHGTSMRYPWLSDLGKAYLGVLRTYGVEAVLLGTVEDQ